MKLFKHNIALIAFTAFLVCPLMTSAQWNKKPYPEWSEKDALKMLNESP